jgi:hypothetical protein
VEADAAQEEDMELDTIAPALIIGVLLVGLACYFYAFSRRSSLVLEKWVSENGYQLLSAQLRLFRKGPYWWSSRSQSVYRVEILDAEGNMRSGWVRCGSWWMGVFSDQVEAKLDA